MARFQTTARALAGSCGGLPVQQERMPDREVYSFEIAAEGRSMIMKGDSKNLLPVLPPCRLVSVNHGIEHLPVPLEVIRALCHRRELGGVLERIPRSKAHGGLLARGSRGALRASRAARTAPARSLPMLARDCSL